MNSIDTKKKREEKIAATINHNAKELDRQPQNMTHKSNHDDIQEAR